MQEKRLQNRKNFILLQRFTGTYSNIFSKDIFYILLLLYGTLDISFFKFIPTKYKLLKPCIIRKNFLVRIPPHRNVEQNQSRRRFNQFLVRRPQTLIFFFQLIKILPVTDLVENFKSKKLCYKISVSEKLRSGMYLCDENEPKHKKIKIFST